MKVKLKYYAAGPEGCSKPGDVIEIDSKTAKELIESGQAVALERKVEEAEVETSAKGQAEAKKAQSEARKAALGKSVEGGDKAQE